MALISCPHCQKQISSFAKTCNHCEQSVVLSNEQLEQKLKKHRRELKNKLYKWRMLSYVAMTIALIGAVPMVWDYARSIDYGFDTSLFNHWGSIWVFAGFILYVLTRIMIFAAKKP